MKSSNKIAVVIVNWNSGEYLVECLRSLKGQTVQPDRVLIVDNASTDASLQGLEQEFEEWDFSDENRIFANSYSNLTQDKKKYVSKNKLYPPIDLRCKYSSSILYPSFGNVIK